MFIGHYGPALALTSARAKVPLWHYVVAVQFLDYLWAAFILTGVENARVTPGFLSASPLDLYYMPYTHSLAAALAWSIVGAGVYGTAVNREAGAKGAALIGVAIFSHWLADLLVHAKDLALYPGSATKLGLGLWSSVAVSQTLEAALTAGGFLLYLAATRPKGGFGRAAPIALCAALIGAQAVNLILAPPGDIREIASTALAIYSVFAALAYFMDRTRAARQV